jgi:hypothetical protein
VWSPSNLGVTTWCALRQSTNTPFSIRSIA